MKKRLFLSAALFVACSWSTSALAQANPFSLGLKVSTLGPGLETGFGVSEWLGFRLGVNALEFQVDETVDDVDYDADMRLLTGAALVDIYPFVGIFRITGGFMLNGNELELTGKSSRDATINGNRYTAEEIGTISGKADFELFAPYVGLGWSSNPRNQSGWGLAIDLGVMYHGDPSVSSLKASGLLGQDEQLQADLEKEKKKVESEYDYLQYYPVVSFTFQYNF